MFFQTSKIDSGTFVQVDGQRDLILDRKVKSSTSTEVVNSHVHTYIN